MQARIYPKVNLRDPYVQGYITRRDLERLVGNIENLNQTELVDELDAAEPDESLDIVEPSETTVDPDLTNLTLIFPIAVKSWTNQLYWICYNLCIISSKLTGNTTKLEAIQCITYLRTSQIILFLSFMNFHIIFLSHGRKSKTERVHDSKK